MRRFPLLAALAATDIAIGFGVQILVLLSVGIGVYTDAYYAGQAPAIVLLAILQFPLQRAVVAAYADSRTDRYAASKLVVAVVGSTAILFTGLSLAGAQLFGILYPELPEDARAVAINVLHVQAIAAVLMAGNLVFLSLNHVGGRFLQCELAIVTSAVVAACLVVLTVERYGVLAAAYGQVVKAMMCGGIYLWMLRGKLTWASPPWEQIWKVVRPLASAGALSKLTPLVDRTIAAAAASGSLTVLVFTQAIYGASVGVAERAIVAPRLPELKRSASSQISFRVVWQLALAGAVLVMVLVACAAIAAQIDLIVDRVSAPVMGLMLDCVILLAGFPIGALSAQWMAANMVFVGQPGLSARIMTWCFLLSVPVKLLGFEIGGIRGLAIAMSCYYLASALSLCLVLRALRRASAAAA